MHILHVEIIGIHNKNCHFLENNVLMAISQLGITAQVTCIADAEEVKQRRLSCTPALIIDGRVVSQGQNISSRHIQAFLLESMYSSPQRKPLNRVFCIK